MRPVSLQDHFEISPGSNISMSRQDPAKSEKQDRGREWDEREIMPTLFFFFCIERSNFWDAKCQVIGYTKYHVLICVTKTHRVVFVN